MQTTTLLRVNQVPPTSVNRIALIRPSALGDVCRTVPVLSSLRRAYPHAAIDWIVQDSYVDAVRAHPDLSRVIPFARRRFSRVGRSLGVTREWLAWAKSLRSLGYDVVYDLQGLARSGLMAWMTRAPKRVGFVDAREAGYLGYTHRHKIPAALHTVERMLALVQAEGVEPVRDMRLYVPAEAAAWWESKSTALQVAAGRYAVIAATSRWVSKRWPADRFATLARGLFEGRFDRVVLVGGKDEREQIQPLLELAARDDRLIDLVGETSVGGLMAVIEKASFVIANDSAALHMAVGFDRPYVALFGPTDVSLVGPYRGEQWVIQPPVDPSALNHKDSSIGSSIMDQISVEQVMQRISQRLSAADAAPSAGAMSP